MIDLNQISGTEELRETMSKKSVREMSPSQRRWHSINVKSFVIMLLLTIGIGGVVMVVGAILYLYGVYYQYSYNVWNMANAEAVVLEDQDVRGKCDEILDVYSGFTEEKRGDGTDAVYRDAFEPVIDDTFRSIQTRMQDLKARNGPLNAFIVAVKEGSDRMIYLVDSDPNEDSFIYPGTWDTYDKGDLSVLLHGRPLSRMEKRFHIAGGVQAFVASIEPYGPRCTGGSTLYEKDGFTVLVCVDERLDTMIDISLLFMRQYCMLLLFITLLGSAVGTLLIRRHMVTPINRLAKAAAEYGEDQQKMETGTKYFDNLRVRKGDELENLAITMQEMEEDLAVYVQNLTKATAEQERIDTELALAARIQSSTLENNFPAFPDRGEFDVFASMEPAKVVGGDFYDFFLIDDDHLAVEIADVSGKGIPASLFMMASKILLSGKAKEGFSPAEVLESVNEQICQGNQEEMFITVWLGILEISTGKFVSANAGHEYTVQIHVDGHVELVKEKHGFVIGGLEGVKYSNFEMQLEKGDRIFVYTDGVTEATTHENELFGMERLVKAIEEAAPQQGARQILESVHAAVDRFVGDNEQFDDMTMLCLEYRGAEPAEETCSTDSSHQADKPAR